MKTPFRLVNAQKHCSTIKEIVVLSTNCNNTTLSQYSSYRQHLNYRGTGGTRPPIEIWALVDERKKTYKVWSNKAPNSAGIVMQKKKQFNRRRRPFFIGLHLIFGEKALQFPAKPFFNFWRSPVFGRKKTLSLWFRPKKAFEFRRRPYFFFGDHLFLAGKKPNICDFGQRKRLNFGEDLIFFLEITCFWPEKT